MPLIRRSRAVALALLACLALPVYAEAPPPPLSPREEMSRQLASLRTAQAISQAIRTTPLTAAEFATSRQLYEDVISHYPDQAEPHVALGEYLLGQGLNQAASQQWDLALTLDPKRHDVLAAQADLFLQTGQTVAAADAFEKALLLAPTNADYCFGLAHIYTLFRRELMTSRLQTEAQLITRGTEYFRQAAELAPDNLTYAKAYAEAFYTQPDPDWTLARAAWESLLARSAEKDFIRSHLVRINIRLHDKAAASLHLAAITDPAFSRLKVRLQKQIDKL